MTTPLRFDPTLRGAALSGCEAAIALFFPDVPEITAPALAARLAVEPPPLVLDVRTMEEHRRGRIPGARPALAGLPVTALLSPAELDGTAPIVCACSVGLRSGHLARALLQYGVPRLRVANLRGGIFRWARSALPLVDDTGPTLAVHPFDARWGRLLDR